MSSVTCNRLESLSNELLLDIFEYLDAYNLYQSFFGLNHRINILLQLARLHILYNPSFNNKTVWDTISSFINPSQIRILSSINDTKIDEALLSAITENLHSITLHGITRHSVDKIFQKLPINNKIRCLRVQENYHYSITDENTIPTLLLVKHGHHLVSLVNLSLYLSGLSTDFPLASVVFLQLRHLSITNCYWSTNLLQFLRDKTPNLRSLKCSQCYLKTFSSDMVLKNIHELHIKHSSGIYNLHRLFPLFPNLRRLHADCEGVHRSEIINGTQWQVLIEKNFPNLKQFTLDFGEGVDEEIVKSFYTGAFWSTKKVKVKMIINKTESRFRLVKTIYFGKEWKFNYIDSF